MVQPAFTVIRDDPKEQLPESGLEIICLADVKPRPIDWLWPNFLAIGKVHVLAGDGGQGKSTILCDITARVTTAGDWPDGAPGLSRGSVMILAAEDDVEDTLAPRLMAAGAEMGRVHTIRSAYNDDRTRRTFNVQADLARLEQEIEVRKDVRLVIIDPISSYLGKVDSHKNAEVRTVLEPLGDMASRLRVAIIANNHFSKGGGGANSRIIGSVAFVNQARAAFIVTPDAEDKTRFLLMPSKMNIAPIQYGLAYRIESKLIEVDGQEILTSWIIWEPERVTITADQALAALTECQEVRTAKDEAVEFLRTILAAGPVPANDVQRQAREAGIASKPLRAARDALGITAEKAGFEAGWVWRLPEDAL